MLILLGLVAVWAGFQNALAGGGSFVTLPALILSGLDARTANIASTLALFAGQVTTGWVGRRQASGAGGLGFSILVLVSLAAAGLAVRGAAATKNVLAGVVNAAAVAVFLFTPGVPWLRIGVIAIGAIAGGYAGALALKRVDERVIRGFVVTLGVVLSVGLFLRQSHLPRAP